jgi:Branched-chain amino acid transport system / permease component
MKAVGRFAALTLGGLLMSSAAYLAGVNTKRVTIICVALCGVTAGLAGVLRAGYSQNAYQGMGEPHLLPAIAAVVIGGTNILGARPLSRHAGRGHTDRALERRAVDHGNAQGCAAGDLRGRHNS